MDRYFTLSALIIISAIAVTESLGDDLQARWDMRIGDDRLIFQHLLNHYSTPQVDEPALEVYAWLSEEDLILKIPNPILREATTNDEEPHISSYT